MLEAQEQAKQLDSVTDQVHEKEVDASKALQAMSSLSIGGGGGGGRGGGKGGGPTAPPSSSTSESSKAPASADSDKAAEKGGGGSAIQTSPAVPVVLDPKDVQLIVDELEVTHEAAEKALRQAIAEGSKEEAASADPPVVAALRILVTSI